MKICCDCKQDKPKSEFSRRGDKLQAACKQCKASYNRKHYQDNKQSYIDRTRNQEATVKSWLANEKRVPCMDCDKSYPPHVMDFDHVRGKKLFGLCGSEKIYGFNQIKEERAKCEVVCSNCHRERTHKSVL